MLTTHSTQLYLKRNLELVDLGETGKTYQPQEIFTVEDPKHTEAFGEGKRVMIQATEPFVLIKAKLWIN